jgi:arabinogalactan endo-1,4-beta-galactosidase
MVRAGRYVGLTLTALGIAAIALCLDCTRPDRAGAAGAFIKGADISFLQQIEANGGVYYEDGAPKDLLDILEDHGFSHIRVRVWHSPAGGINGLDSTLQMAARVKARGLGLLLDLHYSDTWADPGKQYKPAAWEGISFEALKDSIRAYTSDVMSALKAQGTLPDWVQVGNEIICGMLWDEGRVCAGFDTPGQWANLGELVTEAIGGIEDTLEPGDSVKIVIHIDRGGDLSGSIWFLDNLIAQGVDFDVIGQSFYPWWHGTLTDVGTTLRGLAARYDKHIAIVETAYPWTLGWYDNTHNQVGLPSQLHPGFPATVDGQRDFLIALMDTVRNCPDGKGLGVFYWAPECISAPGFGSSWENVTLFDFQGNLLHSIAAFDSAMAGSDGTGQGLETIELNRSRPNPFRTTTTIGFSLGQDAHAALRIYNTLGQEVDTLVDARFPAGRASVAWDGKDRHGRALAPGVYLCRLEAGSDALTRKILLLR